jgi:hypothetical protein
MPERFAGDIMSFVTFLMGVGVGYIVGVLLNRKNKPK